MQKLFDIDKGNVVLNPTALCTIGYSKLTLDLKPIPGFNKYLISSFGRIWSRTRKVKYSRDASIFATRRGKWLHTTIGNNGYVRVQLQTDTVGSKHVSVHRLVLMAWDRLPINDEHCDHINGNRQDNRVENLKWETPAINSSKPHSKYYILTFPDNTEKLVFNLSKYCRDNGLYRSALIGYIFGGRSYKGIKIREISKYDE